MAGRIRSIKPEVLDDEIAARLSDTAWRLWVSSWVLADDHGNLRAGESYLAANVWQDTSREVARFLHEVIDGGFFEPYAVRGQRYVHIKGWVKHQRVDNAGKARVPSPSEDDGTWNQQLGGLFAYSRGDSPRQPESAEDSPLRAHARPHARNPAARPPISITDHRPPTDERERAPAPARAKSKAGAEDETGEPVEDASGVRPREPLPKRSRAEAESDAARGGAYAIRDDFALTPERRAYAEMQGVTDVDVVFEKFRQMARTKAWFFDAQGWDGKWAVFCIDERKIQQRDRARAGSGGGRGPRLQPDDNRGWDEGDGHD